jgi:hypothetical protein
VDIDQNQSGLKVAVYVRGVDANGVPVSSWTNLGNTEPYRCGQMEKGTYCAESE